MNQASGIAGKRILIVEDDYFIYDELATNFLASGAEVVGSAATVDDALDLVDHLPHIDAAVLDISLNGKLSFPVARMLRERGVPFLFTTGYDADAIPAEFKEVPRCEKPVDPDAIASALTEAKAV